MKLNVIIVGSGMYVCGRGTKSYGTILPAVIEAKREGFVENISLCVTSQKSLEIFKTKLSELDKLMGTKTDINYFVGENSQQEAIKNANENSVSIISVPDHLHCSIASEFIKAKIATLVVKPLAPTIKEVKKLIELQDQFDVHGMVEFHKRFDRSNLKLKESIQDGKIGDVLYFIVEYSQRKSVPLSSFKEWAHQSNIFQYLGIHYVDIIYFCTNAIPKRVMSIGQKNFIAKNNIDTYDSTQTVIEWETLNKTKFISTFHCNWIDPESTSVMSDQRIKVIGTKGRFEADQKNRGLMMVTDEDGISEPNPDFCQFYENDLGAKSIKGYGIDSVFQFLKDTINLKENKITRKSFEKNRPTFKASLIPVAIIEASNKSLEKNGEWVEVVF